MSRVFDCFYFIAIPLTLACVLVAFKNRQWRYPALITSLLFMAGWIAVIHEREERYDYLSQLAPSSATELKTMLGEPEKIVKFEEGDELWTFSVRSFPWSKIHWYSIYKGRILSSSWRENIGLFESEPVYIRDSKEAAHVRKSLQWFDQSQK